MDKSVVDVILWDGITRDNLRPLADALNAQLALQQPLYTTQLTHLQTQIVEVEKQRRKYAKLIDDDPSATLVAELKKYEQKNLTLQEQKRQLEMNGPESISSEPITDAQLDAYIERVRAVLNSDHAFLAKSIIESPYASSP